MSLLVSEFSCRWDESGVDPGTKTRSRSDRPVLVVAGYLAHADDWEALEEKWIAVLARHGLAERGFHMVEFFNHRYPYSKLSKTDYGALIDALLDIVHFHPRMFVSFSMETKDYMDVIKARHLLEEDIVRAYHILARRCILMISDVARLSGHKDKILHIFHHNNPAWPTFESSFTEEIMEALNILRPISQSHKDVVSLQAADMLAHQLARKRIAILRGQPDNRGGYVDRLCNIGAQFHLGSGELFTAYLEEMELERHKHDSHLARLSRCSDPIALEASRELFKLPPGYPFDGMFRGDKLKS